MKIRLLIKLMAVCIVATACAEEKMEGKIDFGNKFEASPFFFNGKSFTVKEGKKLSEHENQCNQLIQICFESLEGKLEVKESAKAFIESENINGEEINIIYIQNFLEKGERGSDYSVAIYINDEGEIINILSGS